MATEREIRMWNRQRDGARTSCTAEIEKGRAYLGAEADATAAQLQSSITVLKDFRATLGKFDSDILLHIDGDEEAAAEVQAAAAHDYGLLQHISDLSAKLESIMSAGVTAAIGGAGSVMGGDRPNSPGHNGSFRSTDHHGQSVRLPKLQLGKFGGDPLKWAEFWDSYSTTIHDNGGLSDIEKFQYLRSFLLGDALRLADGYRLTAVNYNQAVESLKERYGNEQLAVFSHFKSMIEMPVSTHDTNQLQTMYDDCEKHIRSLVALGRDEDTFAEVFTPLILSKLPSYVKMELYRRNGSKPWELSNLREWLKEEIRARDYSQRTFGGSPTGSTNRGDTSAGDHHRDRRGQQHHGHKPQNNRKSSGYNGTSSALVTHDKPTPKCKCAFCGESHFSDQCKRFPDVQSRRSCLTGRCYICFSDQHGVKNCQNRRACAHCNKQGHNRSLCYAKFAGSPQQKSGPSMSLNVSDTSGVSGQSINTSTLLSHGETAILQTAVCSIEGNRSMATARMLFDTGCFRTFITSELSKRIGARPVGKERVSIAGFTSTKRKTETYDTVEFDVILRDGRRKRLVVNVIDHITTPIQKIPLDVKSNPALLTMHLAEPLISSSQQVHVDVLLGGDYYYEFIGREWVEMSGGLILLPSSLGLIATGKVSKCNVSDTTVTSLYVDALPESRMHIERFWSLEDIGVKSPSTVDGDEEALMKFNKTVQFEDGRYQVQLPFKAYDMELPENKQLAFGRLKSQFKRLGSNAEILTKYDDIIQDQLKKGVVEVAPSVPTGDRVHYLPHQGVITPSKSTTKLRVVYDASAKASKSAPSLNDCLNRGPVILDDLCGLLLKFRLHSIGLVSDIEKAFLQIGLQQCDRDVTRFFWVNDITKPPEGSNLVTLRFCRVLFGAVSSPFLLGAVIKHHLGKSSFRVADDIDGCVYVDNVITGKQTVNDAIGFYNEAKQVFNEASMNVREWFTNNQAVRESFKTADRGGSTVTKVLGLKWDTEGDTLSCGSFFVQDVAVNTKRLMLKYLAKIFDPCGYFSAITVTGKLLIQKLWKATFDWDDPLPDEIIAEWRKCSDSLQRIGTRPIPRCYNVDIGSAGTDYHLHCFCDASGKAYAAVVYLTVTSTRGTSSDIVFAKSRVGPIKQLTIPRMELMAVVIGVRILSFVKLSLGLPVSKQFVWSDSQCVLHWLAKCSVQTVFVKNRVSEINTHREVEFRYVPTAVNPADLSSRGCSFDNLVDNSLWWHGPDWLVNSNLQWPPNPINFDNYVEEQESDDAVPVDAVTLADGATPDSLVTLNRFSSLTRLLRVTGWIIRFINNCRGQQKREGPLKATELRDAQLYWDNRVQSDNFGSLLAAQQDVKAKQLSKQLGLYADSQGLIRCGGRLDAADIASGAKHPLLLPKNNYYTDLIVSDCHRRLLHAGVAHTLAQVRQQYWVVHGRNQVKRVINGCHICKVAHGGPYHYPEPPPLPDFRVTRQTPFSTVGIDYMGPLYINNREAGRQSKVWICLFTCAVTRAVHLEVVNDLTALQFVLCLRRFVATFGKPDIVVSDNAKHFVKTSLHLDRMWREIQRAPVVQEWSSTKGIEWKFITELSPWMGGFYERMVGVVNSAMKKTLGARWISFVELQTVVSEISGVVNSRPLLYVDSNNEQTSLTPAHFLGGPHAVLPYVDIDIDEHLPKPVTNNDLVDLWRRSNKILDNFWKTWKNQYLLGLRERGYNFKQRNTCKTAPSLGDVVIVKDNLFRKHWRVGRIVRLPVGRDGNCRSAVVQLGTKKTINRPLRLLFPLETGCGEVNGDGSSTTTPDRNDRRQRLRRRAFVNANQQIRDVTAEGSSSDDNSTEF